MAKEKEVATSPWHTHKVGCKTCRNVSSKNTASMALCCLVGAPILKDFLVQQFAPQAKARRDAAAHQFIQKGGAPDKRASKQKLKEVMRYK